MATFGMPSLASTANRTLAENMAQETWLIETDFTEGVIDDKAGHSKENFYQFNSQKVNVAMKETEQTLRTMKSKRQVSWHRYTAEL